MTRSTTFAAPEIGLATRIPLWLKAVAFGLVFWASGEAGQFLSVPGSPYVSFWLPAGFYVSALLLSETRNWRWFLLAALVANLVFDLPHGTPFLTVLGFYCANTIEALTGAALVRRFVAKVPTLANHKEFLGLVLYSAGVSTIVGATAGAATLVASGMSDSYWTSWLTWWRNESLAILLVTPFVLSWFSGPVQWRQVIRRPAKMAEAAVLLAGMTGLGWLLLVEGPGIMSPYKVRLMPFLLWAALRLGLRGATAANLLLALLVGFLTTHFLWGLTPQQIADGAYVGVMQCFLGISIVMSLVPAVVLNERNLKVRELQESEERFRNLTAASFEAVCITENGRILDVNDQGLKMLGYEREEVIGRSILDCIAPESRELAAERIRLDLESTFKHKLIRKDGSAFHVESRARMLRLGDRTVRMTAVRDITEFVRAEEALRLSEEKFRSAMQHSPIGMALVASNGRWLEVNPALCKIVGYSHEEMLAADFQALTHPDDRETDVESARRLLAGEIKTYDREKRYLHKRGHAVWVQLNVSLVRNSDGTPRHFVSQIQDISERKLAEQQQRELEEKLRQAQKLEALGTLAGGTAHEFNNMLGVIIGFSEVAKSELDANDPVQANLDEVLLAAQRAKEIVRQILTFSQQQRESREPMRLDTVVREVMKVVRNALPAPVAVHLDVLEDGAVILGNATQIHQVLMNICVNAWHAMERGAGAITVTQRSETLDRNAAVIHPGLRETPYVHLAIADDGQGMDASTLARIFEPFFTTKGQGKGTGLGLAVVHGIMQAHDGVIFAQSEPGRGATFHLYFPIHAHSPAEAVPIAAKPAPKGGGQHILLVDDEPALMSVAAKFLIRFGYEATRTGSATEALNMIQDNGSRFDLVITDLTMPGMNGAELARALQAVQPELPVVLASGYGDALAAENPSMPNVRNFLQKPFTSDELIRTIQEILPG